MGHNKRDNKNNKNNKKTKAGSSEQQDNKAGLSENALNSDRAGSGVSITSEGLG